MPPLPIRVRLAGPRDLRRVLERLARRPGARARAGAGVAREPRHDPAGGAKRGGRAGRRRAADRGSCRWRRSTHKVVEVDNSVVRADQRGRRDRPAPAGRRRRMGRASAAPSQVEVGGRRRRRQRFYESFGSRRGERSAGAGGMTAKTGSHPPGDLGDYDVLVALFDELDELHRQERPDFFRSFDGPARTRAQVEQWLCEPGSTVLVAERWADVIGPRRPADAPAVVLCRRRAAQGDRARQSRRARQPARGWRVWTPVARRHRRVVAPTRCHARRSGGACVQPGCQALLREFSVSPRRSTGWCWPPAEAIAR